MSSSVTTTATAVALTPQPLGEIAAVHDSLTFVWADLDGLHVGRCPDRAPGATHLWGWAHGTALLARLEGSHVVAGLRVTRGAAGQDVTVRPLKAWRSDDRRVAGLPSPLSELELVTVEYPGPVELVATAQGWR